MLSFWTELQSFCSKQQRPLTKSWECKRLLDTPSAVCLVSWNRESLLFQLLERLTKYKLVKMEKLALATSSRLALILQSPFIWSSLILEWKKSLFSKPLARWFSQASLFLLEILLRGKSAELKALSSGIELSTSLNSLKWRFRIFCTEKRRLEL